MASYNHVILAGNLTSDIDLRHLPSGTAVADLRLAVSEKFKRKDGESVEKTVFVDVAVWDKQAENCAKYLGKGSPVLIEGRLQMDEWQTKEGEKRTKLRIRANTVQFLSSSPRSNQDQPQERSPANKPEQEFTDDFEDDPPF